MQLKIGFPFPPKVKMKLLGVKRFPHFSVYGVTGVGNDL